MVRRIRKVVKSRPTRERRKLVIVGTEGRNKTEELYLRHLEQQQKSYHFIFAKGNETDPVSIVKNTVQRAKKEGVSQAAGDMAVSIFDLDANLAKTEQFNQAKQLAAQKGVELFTSNPCFEIWYLAHFAYSTRPFNSSSEAIQELDNYLPNYQKNFHDFNQLAPLTDTALENCKRLEVHHIEHGAQAIPEFNNPKTDFFRLVEIILGEQKQ